MRKSLGSLVKDSGEWMQLKTLGGYREAAPVEVPIDSTEYRFKLALINRRYDEVTPSLPPYLLPYRKTA
jgi:hypothetical protein